MSEFLKFFGATPKYSLCTLSHMVFNDLCDPDHMLDTNKPAQYVLLWILSCAIFVFLRLILFRLNKVFLPILEPAFIFRIQFLLGRVPLADMIWASKGTNNMYIQLRDEHRNSPFHGAAMHPRYHQALNHLLRDLNAAGVAFDEQIDLLNDVNNRGETALILAVKEGNYESVRTLVWYHTSPAAPEGARSIALETKDAERGRTAYLWAVEKNYVRIVELLGQAGADLDATDRHNYTAWTIASAKGHHDLSRRLHEASRERAERNAPQPDYQTEFPQFSAHINIAVVGQVSVGKSRWLNAVRNLSIDDPEWAAVNIEQETSAPTPYRFLAYPNVILWDLPGFGVMDVPTEEYRTRYGIRFFDAVVLMHDQVFPEENARFLTQLVDVEVPCAVVRNKVDEAVASLADSRMSEETMLATMREKMDEDVRKAWREGRHRCLSGEPTDAAPSSLMLEKFIISNRQPLAYDFEALKTWVIDGAHRHAEVRRATRLGTRA
jgi:ankyrin repeat protein